MKFSAILALALGLCVAAAPLQARHDSDDSIAYPDEKLYAEEYKRSINASPRGMRLKVADFAPGDSDESVAYPDEKLYAEEYKRAAHSADDDVAYPDEKLYAEEYKRHDSDESVAYPDEKLYAEEY